MITMKLLNIRLGPDDVARVRALRARGVKLSQLLREAIRAEHDRRTQIPRGRDAEEAMAEIYAQHPCGEAGDRQGFDAHRRRRFRKEVARHVRRRMSR